MGVRGWALSTQYLSATHLTPLPASPRWWEEKDKTSPGWRRKLVDLLDSYQLFNLKQNMKKDSIYGHLEISI